MCWGALLEKRIKAKRQILFSKEDEPIRELMALIEKAPRKAVILWALDMAQEGVQALENDARAESALAVTRLWAAGKIKMPLARRAILDCHDAAKMTDDARDIALFHAVGQACATVHTVRHAIGYPIYALTALIRETGIADCEVRIEEKLCEYRERLLYRERQYRDEACTWAEFIRD